MIWSSLVLGILNPSGWGGKGGRRSKATCKEETEMWGKCQRWGLRVIKMGQIELHLMNEYHSPCFFTVCFISWLLSLGWEKSKRLFTFLERLCFRNQDSNLKSSFHRRLPCSLISGPEFPCKQDQSNQSYSSTHIHCYFLLTTFFHVLQLILKY